jgi:superoxide reductase
MSKRRDFIKTSVAVAAGAMVTKLSLVSASESSFAPGLVYTEDNPGKWAKKVESHLPTVKVDGSKITITTDHGMSEKHYIVRHTLVSGEGKVLGARTFSVGDEEAVSIYKVEGKHPVLYATSFCNKHDLWVKEFSI